MPSECLAGFYAHDTTLVWNENETTGGSAAIHIAENNVKAIRVWGNGMAQQWAIIPARTASAGRIGVYHHE